MQNIFLDANVIYEAGNKAMKSSKFKYSTQLFEMNHLLYTAMIQRDLRNGTYRPDEGKKFLIRERGKERLITSNSMTDKTVNHIISDEVLTPALKKYLIYDNSASQKGKGVSFHRKRFEAHLRKYFREHGSNQGYILLGDFKGYYANILHDKCYEVLAQFLSRSIMNHDELRYTLNLLAEVFATFGLDKGIDIGNQNSQNIGLIYPFKLDNFAKIVKGIKYYGRYTDDFYAISESKQNLLDLLEGMKLLAKEFGITINERKTRIVKLSGTYRHLQNCYTLTDTGRVICRIHPKNITRERRKLKAYKRLFDAGMIDYNTIENAFKSWLGGNFTRMSRRQIFNLTQLFLRLFRRLPKWQKVHSRLRLLTEHKSADWD